MHKKFEAGVFNKEFLVRLRTALVIIYKMMNGRIFTGLKLFRQMRRRRNSAPNENTPNVQAM